MIDLITIYNYDNNYKYMKMLEVWLKQANKHKTENMRIVILSNREITKEISLLKEKYSFVYERKENCNADLSKYSHLKNHNQQLIKKHNILFKLWNLTNRNTPFIFIDVDAFILEPLEHLENIMYDKPWIGTNHQNIPRHTENMIPFLNSGVQVVSDPTFLNYFDILDNINKILCSGFDQAVLYTYFKKIGYDYTHKDFPLEWNACAGYTTLTLVDNEYKGEVKLLEGKGNKVYINHYWDEFKPWNLNCPLYKN